jgi:hypothetical protein
MVFILEYKDILSIIRYPLSVASFHGWLWLSIISGPIISGPIISGSIISGSIISGPIAGRLCEIGRINDEHLSCTVQCLANSRSH